MLDLQRLQADEALFSKRYRLIKQLGRGGFSEVWLAEDTVAQIKVALKLYVPNGGLDSVGIEMFRKEFSIVCNFNHSSLLRPFSFDTYARHPFLVLPYLEKGSASCLIGKANEDTIWKLFEDVAQGLAYLHEHPTNKIVHQDIKPANILISSDNHFVITDFGISTQLRSTMRMSMAQNAEISGTLAYMGPERFGGILTPIMASDIWSLGASVYELMTGMVPFGENGGLNQKRGATLPKLKVAYSKNLQRLVGSCLNKDPWKRPSAKQLVECCKKREAFSASNIKKLIYPLLVCGIIAVGSGIYYYWSHHEAQQTRINYRLSQEDSILLAKIEEVDSLFQLEKHSGEAGTLDSVNTQNLAHVLSLAKSLHSVKTNSDSLKNSVILINQEIQVFADTVYKFLSGMESAFKEVGASEASKVYKAKKQLLEDYRSNI